MMSLRTNKDIAYILSTPKFCLMKPFFYSGLTINETSAMKVLHTIDWSWYDEDLKWWWTKFSQYLHMKPQWHDAPTTKLIKKRLILCNLDMFDEKQKGINGFRWMNFDICKNHGLGNFKYILEKVVKYKST